MNTLVNPVSGDLFLVVAPKAGGIIMLDLVARLACRGALRLLDGGNRLDVYRCNLAVARALSGQIADLPVVLGRIRLARAFTCYQMVTLLEAIPAESAPTLVIDLLATFYDESVPARESLRLLQICLTHLQRLNCQAPVAVSARPSPLGGRPELLETLQAAATHLWTLEPDVSAPPPRLF